MKVSIFVPVYNEEKILEENIKKIYNKLKELKENFEIFIVDDNSKDKTEIVGKKLSKNDNIKCLRFNFGPTRRENLAESFKKATGDIILFMDLDLSTDLYYLKRLIEEIKKGNDVAIGSRYLGIKAKRKLTRKIISFFYNLFMKYYFGSKIEDHQCGFKAFKRDVILDLIKNMGYDKSLDRGWFWDVELLIRAQRKHYKIIEFPIEWKYRESSSFNIKRELRIMRYILMNGKRINDA